MTCAQRPVQLLLSFVTFDRAFDLCWEFSLLGIERFHPPNGAVRAKNTMIELQIVYLWELSLYFLKINFVC